MSLGLSITGWCVIRNGKTFRKTGMEPIPENFVNFADAIKALYRKEGIAYPKFFKMDHLSKLGFLCAELALRGSRVPGSYREEDVGVVISNSSSSLDTDLAYFDTIKEKSSYFPSPSVFVYTLPNILIGELCIRHRIKGENAFHISPEFEPEILEETVTEMIGSGRIKAAVCGWVEKLREDYEALILIVEQEEAVVRADEDEETAFTAENIRKIYQNNV